MLHQTAGEHGRDFETGADLRRVLFLALIAEDSAAGQNAQTRVLRQGSDHAFSYAVAEVVGVGVGIGINKGQHGDGVNVARRAIAQEQPSAHASRKHDEGGQRRDVATAGPDTMRLRCRRFARLAVPFQPLQVGAHLGSMLVAQLAVFLQRLADHPFQFRRQHGVETERRGGRTMQNSVSD